MTARSHHQPAGNTIRGKVYAAIVTAGKPVTQAYIEAESGLDSLVVGRTLSTLCVQRWIKRCVHDEQYVFEPGPGPEGEQATPKATTARELALESALQELLAEVMRSGMAGGRRLNQAVRLGVEALQHA